MAAQNSAGEELSLRRRRTIYRAWHRGTKEMDLVLGPYADAHVGAMQDAELTRLETLMDEEDTDLLKWVMGQEVPPANIDTELLATLVDYRARTAAQK